MAGTNSLAKYTWLVDTLRRCGRLTRAELNRRWQECSLSNGAPLSRRSFYNYRAAILDLFGLVIEYDPSTNEYFIDEDTDTMERSGSESVTNWLLNSAAMSGMLSDARSISERIFLEPVPSARQNLAPIIDAVKNNRAIRFTYHPFSRTLSSEGVVVEPYLLKLFRQRWYVAGRNVAENKLKTYALDRITDIEITTRGFQPDPTFNPATYFSNSFGIVVDASEPRHVTLRADSMQAKYLRALPLHPSQEEMVHDGYSIFHYKILLTPDFLQELMSLGPYVTVLSPPELRTMLTERLRRTLRLYDGD